jgi:two-component system, sensor histidine kinase and response regulator
MDKSNTSFKILVVDDNPKNIQIVGTILREADYEIGFAFDGRQALDILNESGDYDLVLLDIKMPVMDGYEVCRVMKNDDRYKDIPVIFISASHETENIIIAFDTGGVDYVTKPFNTKELLARVNTHVQLKERTREVKNYVRELEKVNATKDKFFSIIAHDLKNPFEGILMICRNILMNPGLPPTNEISRQIEMIASVTGSGNKLLENLLLWSRSQTGSIAFIPNDIYLDPIIIQCIDSISTQARAKDIEIHYSSSPEIHVMTDEAMLTHVIRNLLTNAVKFSDSYGKISIRVEKVPAAIAVSVIDNGIGISDQDKNNLFRIDGNICSRPGTHNETGSGLGLILCNEFVEKMGGVMSVESAPGEGSRFTFTLPVS